MLRFFPLLPSLLLAASVGGFAAAPLAAQDALPISPVTFASRAQIDSMATAAERMASAPRVEGRVRRQKEFEAALLRLRLESGDFAVGDRLVLVVEGQPTLSDTFTVRSGGTLRIPGLPDLSLRGVLRSEVEDRLGAEIGRYVREPRVHVTPLLRIAVLGNVARPGYYALPADMLLSDAVMAAGGPGMAADLSRVEIRRGAQRLYSAGEASLVMRDGISLDQAHLRAGDEIFIGERTRRNWGTILQGVMVGMGLVSLAVTLGNS